MNAEGFFYTSHVNIFLYLSQQQTTTVKDDDVNAVVSFFIWFSFISFTIVWLFYCKLTIYERIDANQIQNYCCVCQNNMIIIVVFEWYFFTLLCFRLSSIWINTYSHCYLSLSTVIQRSIFVDPKVLSFEESTPKPTTTNLFTPTAEGRYTTSNEPYFLGCGSILSVSVVASE